MLSIPLKQRRHGRTAPPDSIVIHWSAGSGNAEAVGGYLQRSHRQASYHRGIGRDGVVAEYVDLDDTAWHAGDGEPWDDGRRVNDRSVGLCLCLLGYVSKEWATTHPGRTMTAKHRKPGVKSTLWERPSPAMVTALRTQLAEIKARFPSIRYVLGHDDVTKGKIDPGPILDGVDLGLEALGLVRILRRWDLPGDPWEGLDAPAPAAEVSTARDFTGPLEPDAGPTCPEVPEPPPPPPPPCEAPLCKPIAFTAGEGATETSEPDATTADPAPAAKPRKRGKRTDPPAE